MKTKDEIKTEIAKKHSLRGRVSSLAEFISEHTLHSDYEKINTLIDEAMQSYHDQFKPLPSISDEEIANIVGHDSYEYIDGRYVFNNTIIQAFYDGMIAMRDRLTTQKDNNK
jgi:hypothetical protein